MEWINAKQRHPIVSSIQLHFVKRLPISPVFIVALVACAITQLGLLLAKELLFLLLPYPL
jgi:hypothetical protein